MNFNLTQSKEQKMSLIK